MEKQTRDEIIVQEIKFLQAMIYDLKSHMDTIERRIKTLERKNANQDKGVSE